MSDWIVLYNQKSRSGRRACRRLGEMAAAQSPRAAGALRWLPIGSLEELREIPERLILVGGDGTVNHAANWLHDRGGDCEIAIVPSGTGNNLARDLGLPLDLEVACRLALTGRSSRAIDAVRITAGDADGERLMIQSAVLGFPARIGGQYERLRKSLLLRGLLAPAGPHVYRLLAGAGLVAQMRRQKSREGVLHVRCELPRERLEEDVLAIFLGNSGSLGGNFHPCPRASLDDGCLDLCIVRTTRLSRTCRLFRKIVTGDHLQMSDEVVYRQSPGPLQIHLSTPSPLLVDGDLTQAAASYRLEMLGRRFRLIVLP